MVNYSLVSVCGLSAMEQNPEEPQYMPYTVGKAGPDGNLADGKQMQMLEDYVLQTLSNLTDRIASGTVLPNPIVRGQDSSCRFCDYQTVCHMDLCQHEIRPMATTSAEVFWEKIEQEVQKHG